MEGQINTHTNSSDTGTNGKSEKVAKAWSVSNDQWRMIFREERERNMEKQREKETEREKQREEREGAAGKAPVATVSLFAFLVTSLI